MVALRKDVKVGLTIGAIVVAVVGVYAGLTAVSGEKPGDVGTASLKTTPLPDDPARPPTAVAGGSIGLPGTQRPDVSARPPADSSLSGGATNPPAVANPDAPIAIRTEAADDPWAAAFNSGQVETPTTVTPDPTAPRNAAGDRADVLRALSGAATGDGPAGNAASATPVGNTVTASAADGNGALDSSATPTLTRAGDRTHTIQPGDTFSSISAEYYGDSRYFNEIVTANPSVNPNRLKPGTVIRIPALAKKEERSDTADLPATRSIDPRKQYVVQSGDSLHRIASQLYGDIAYAAKLYDANRSLIGADPAKLKPGMVLTLPATPTRR